MKKIILSAICLTLVFTAGFAQKTKAEKEALGLALFAKAQAAVEAKDFVIVPDQYQTSTGSSESNNDDAVFISYEIQNFYLQGNIVCGNSYTNRTTVNQYKQELDKRGTLKIVMQVQGSAITAKVEISVKKGGNYADVIVTPTKGDVRIFSGELVPRSESKYRKRPNEV